MARDQALLYVGIREFVVAVDPRNGEEVWRAELKRRDYTNVLWDGESLFAANGGEVFSLDPRTGAFLWGNEMKGMGLGLVSLASSRKATSSSDANVAVKRQYDAASGDAPGD